MKRIKLVIAYDGTNYCGWQVQSNGITVEEIINKKLSDLTGEKIVVIGASRTDSGVHALGNVAVFDSETSIPPERICYALNQRLPDDIVVQSSCEVPLDFHPRYCDTEKTYEYSILNRKFEMPCLRNYSYFIYLPLDVEKMREACQYIIGEHDFKSFCTPKAKVENTIRNVYSLEIFQENELIKIRIRGNGFLYNMVRIIVGTLVKVGQGIYPPEYVKEIIKACDRTKAGPKAPPQGLTLVGIEYK